MAGIWVGVALHAGCTAPTLPPPQEPVPVIEAVITVGDSLHTFRVYWSDPPDAIIGFRPTSIPADQVALSVFESTTGRFANAVPVPDSAGYFQLPLPVAPKTRYLLGGSVAGKNIASSVTTPDSLRVIVPAADTVFLEDGVDGAPLAYTFQASGAVVYSFWPVAGFFGTDTAGILRIRDPRPLPVPAVFVGLEAQAADYYLAAIPNAARGNISGALGVFGAANRARRVVVWR